MKIILFAANGYVGRVLAEYYQKRNYEVVAVTRRPATFPKGVLNLIWDGQSLDPAWTASLNGADVVVNLAGKSVNCRYTEANKKEIFDSRTFATEVIAKAIQQCTVPPQLWINSASATIYRHAEDRPMDELTGEIGTGFSVEVCKKWEKTFFDTQTPSTRKVALRMAIVLGHTDGVFLRLRNLVKYGLGGIQGNGRQMFSWIHDQDLCRVIDFFLENKKWEGVFNASAPEPVTNKRMMQTLREAMHMPFGLPSPKWLLEMGAVLIGTETELILKSRWVVPTQLLQAGFTFTYPTLKEAVNEIVSHKF